MLNGSKTVYSTTAVILAFRSRLSLGMKDHHVFCAYERSKNWRATRSAEPIMMMIVITAHI